MSAIIGGAGVGRQIKMGDIVGDCLKSSTCHLYASQFHDLGTSNLIWQDMTASEDR